MGGVRAAVLTLLVFAACVLSTTVQARSKHPDNKVVEAANVQAWEIWCIRLGDTGEIVCDLNLVMMYKPHPDFRAMIPRVFLDADDAYYFELEYEWQTSFSDGYLEADNGERFSLADCDRPCLFKGARAAQVVDFLRRHDSVHIHFADYLVQDFRFKVDLRGFREGLDLLKTLQKKHRP